jgi:hypothetical protein
MNHKIFELVTLKSQLFHDSALGWNHEISKDLH